MSAVSHAEEVLTASYCKIPYFRWLPKIAILCQSIIHTLLHVRLASVQISIEERSREW